jgi:DNA-binding NtrC family response regulator
LEIFTEDNKGNKNSVSPKIGKPSLPSFPSVSLDSSALCFDLHETEKKLIAQALAATNGNVTAAAKKLGISRRTLHRKINEMNLAKTKADGSSAS